MAKGHMDHRDRGPAGMPREERAILELSGQRGYAGFTIAELMARSGSNRARFYENWAGKRECFLSAHSSAADELAERLLAAGAASGRWEDGVASALVELNLFTTEEPGLAAGLIVEAHVVGGPALDKRGEVFARLTRALDAGRKGAGGSEDPPRPATAMLILNAIESCSIRALANGDRLAGDLPGMLFLILAYYRGLPEAVRAASRLAAEIG